LLTWLSKIYCSKMQYLIIYLSSVGYANWTVSWQAVESWNCFVNILFLQLTNPLRTVLSYGCKFLLKIVLYCYSIFDSLFLTLTFLFHSTGDPHFKTFFVQGNNKIWVSFFFYNLVIYKCKLFDYLRIIICLTLFI